MVNFLLQSTNIITFATANFYIMKKFILKYKILLSVLLFVIIVVSVSAYFLLPKKNGEDVYLQARSLLAGKWNTSVDNIVVLDSCVVNFNYSEASDYVISAYDKNDTKKKISLIILEQKPFGDVTIKGINPDIMGNHGSSNEYKLMSDNMYACNFCLTNSIDYFYFIPRYLVGEDEIMLFSIVHREISNDRSYVKEYRNDGMVRSFTTAEFCKYTLERLLLSESDLINTSIPTVCSNSKEFYIFHLKEKNAIIDYFELGGRNTRYLVKTMKLKPCSYKNLQLHFDVSDENGKTAEIDLTFYASIQDDRYHESAASSHEERDKATIDITEKGIHKNENYRKDYYEDYLKVNGYSVDMKTNFYLTYHIPGEYEVIDCLEGNFNDDNNTDYLITITKKDGKRSPDDYYHFYTFLGDKYDTPAFITKESTSNVANLYSGRYEKTIDLHWVQSPFNKKLRLFINADQATENYRNVTYYADFSFNNKDKKLYLDKYTGYYSSDGRSYFMLKNFKKGYTLADFFGISKCKTDEDRDFCIYDTSEDDYWFQYAMSNEPDSTRQVMSVAVYDPNLKIKFVPQYFSVLEYLYDHKQYDEASALLDRLCPDEDYEGEESNNNNEEENPWEYPETYFWQGLLAYQRHDYDLASYFMEEYMTNCQKKGEQVRYEAKEIKYKADSEKR